MNDFEGKVVVVTGASSGIGEATAAAFEAAGARVYGLASGSATADAARARHPRVRWLTADLARRGAIDDVVKEITEKEPHLDALVNNAGIYVFAPLEASDEAMVRRHFDVNVIGLVALTQGLLPLLKAAKGAIVNVSSTSARKPSPNQSIYGATKAAVEALTRSWAVELGPSGVRVNAVAPGPTETPGVARLPMPKEMLEAARAHVRSMLPLGRLGESPEVARWIVALADPSVTWVTGQVLGVDGGMAVT